MILSLDDLIGLSQVWLQEWANITVRDEVLALSANVGATSADGSRWVSFWDNWIVPAGPNVIYGNVDTPGVTSTMPGITSVGAITPLVSANYTGIQMVVDPSQYTLFVGNGVRGVVTFNVPISLNSIVTATYRRSMFSRDFWTNAIRGATYEIGNRLLTHLDYTNLDDQTSPYDIVVKQVGMHVLINLQTMLAGLGRTAIGREATIDLTTAAKSIDLGIQTLDKDVEQSCVTWRWSHQPLPRGAFAVPLSGPFSGIGGLY